MRVKSIYLENVRGLPPITLDFFDPVTGQIRPRTVIAGSNGTGKTTVLDTIYVLISMMVTESRKSLETWLMPSQVRVKLELYDVFLWDQPSASWPFVIALGPEPWLSQIDVLQKIAITGDASGNWRFVHRDPPEGADGERALRGA